MKNFITGLFKKKNAAESQPEVKTEPAVDAKKSDAKPADVKVEEPKPAAAKLAEVKSPLPASVVKPETKLEDTPSRPELKAGSAPVLVPLYEKKETVVAKEPEPNSNPNPHQHLPFEGELQSVIQTLVDDLADVYPQTFEQWEDGFRRDENPEQEIAGWVHVAAVLKAMGERYSFHAAEKRECFKILMACFGGSRDSVRKREKPSLLSEEQFNQAITYFYEGGY